MISKAIAFLWLEIRQGNTTAILIVAGLLYAVWITFGQPIYDRLEGRIQTTSEKTIQMQRTIEDLRTKLEQQAASQKKESTKRAVTSSDYGTSLEVEY